jgi:hypothetical protein
LDPQNPNLYYYHDFYLVFHFFPLPDPVDLTGLLDLSLRGGEVGVFDFLLLVLDSFLSACFEDFLVLFFPESSDLKNFSLLKI